MSNEALKNLYVQGLQALVTAGQKGAETAAETLAAVTSPELREIVQQGNQTAQSQAERLGELLRGAGGQPGGQRNEIMEGIQTASKRIRESAQDGATRDAGIVASAQIALHYFIAAHGSLAAYAKALGMGDAASTLKQLTDEAKQFDQRYTELAERSLNQQASAA